jgi:lipopolysaccharide assembly outer membrane protein LptD (OstA)
MTVLLLALLLAFTPVNADAEEAVPVEATVPAETAAPAETAVAGEEKQAPKPTAEELAASTLVQDIVTASYYELVTWCRELKIDDSGSRQDLIKRLAGHYALTLPAEKKEAAQTITVRSARESEYYTIEEVHEKYVVLRGDVELEVKDQADGSVQVIKAATVTFNQTRRTMSAEGNVSYSLTRSGQTDTFVGKSLDFNLDTGEAVFYDGRTTRNMKGKGGDIPFTFMGERITRLANDTVIMRNGSFTSSEDPDDPLYQMRAADVWLLAPSEWAVLNAILYVGQVPVLYLPGFFWPGDDFFFNPSIGYRIREGSYVQTTTYLLGRKKTEESPFSFLQLSDAGDSGYALEPNGLFLRKVPGTTAPKDDGHTLKLLLDVYSRLGIFTGLQGDFSPLATFKAGIGVSRTIFDAGAGGPLAYTPFLPVETGGYATGTQFWNSSSFFGLVIPFRFGLEGTFASSKDAYSVDAAFQYFSDPSFTSDFYTRSEQGILSSLITNTTDAASSGSAVATTAEQTALTWNLTGKLDFAKLFTVPFINTLSLSNLNLKMTWLSDTPDSLSLIEQYDPGSTFYYPSSIMAPSVTMTMGGDIMKLDNTAQKARPTAEERKGADNATSRDGKATPAPDAAERKAAAADDKPADDKPASPSANAKTMEAKDPGKGIRPPRALPSAPEKTAKETDRIPFRAPKPLGDAATSKVNPNASSFAISYQVQPRSTFEHTFDNRDWTTQDSVDYLIRYRTFEAGETSSLTTTASLMNSLLTSNLSLSTEGLWRSRFDPSPAELESTEWESLLLSDLQRDNFTVRTTFQSAVRPFVGIAEFANTGLQYNLGVRLYRIAFTGTSITDPVFQTTGPDWSNETVSAHSLQSTLAFSNAWTKDSLALSIQLPPLDATYTGRVDASAGIFTASVQAGFSLPDTDVVYQPVVMTAGLNTGSGISASEEIQYDLDTSLFTKLTSQVKLGDFSGTYIQQKTADVLQPYSFKIGYEYSGEPIWMWKDRINLNLGVKTHWFYNLQTYTDNLFDFSLSWTLGISEFLDLTFSSVSTNSKTYKYLPGWAAENGTEWLNPLTDLFWSFDFLNSPNRVRSSFKISTLSMKAVQHFNDWDLSLTYSGAPALRTDLLDNKKKYMWTPTFEIAIQWKAVSMVKTDIKGDYEGVSLR